MDHYEQVKQNEDNFMKALQAIRPDIYLLVKQLDESRVNPKFLFFVIKHVAAICGGSRYGDVLTKIEDGNITFVKGTESSLIDEPGLKPVDI